MLNIFLMSLNADTLPPGLRPPLPKDGKLIECGVGVIEHLLPMFGDILHEVVRRGRIPAVLAFFSRQRCMKIAESVYFFLCPSFTSSIMA